MFGWGKAVESAGNGVSTAAEGIRFALTGELPPEERIRLEALLLEAVKIESALKEKQIELTIVDAKSPSKFKSGWRPAIGWIGVLGLFYHFIGYNLLVWYLAIVKSDITATLLNTEGLFPLILGMLGIGGYRSYEKFKGITK